MTGDRDHATFKMLIRREPLSKMKPWMPVTVSCALLGTGFLVWAIRRDRERSSQRPPESARTLAADLAPKETARNEPQPPPPLIVTSAPPAVSATPAVDPEAVIAELTRLRIRSGPHRVADLQEVVFRLRLLAHAREKSIPAMSSYLSRFEDIEYPLAGEKLPETDASDDPLGEDFSEGSEKPPMPPRRSSGTPSSRSERLQFEFLTPPTLRLGLIDVLVEIGGPAAEAVLADLLQRTGRGVEIAYTSRKLETLVPGRYREIALNSARELLVNPPSLAGTSAFDRLQRPYLYSVFEFYHDTRFASVAPQLLVNASGRLDREALRFLTRTTPTEAVLPSLYDAFTKLSPSNHADRSRLLQTALPSAGRDLSANAMIRDVLRDPTIPAEQRGFVMQSLARMPPRRGAEGRGEIDREGVQLRLQFIDQLRSEIPDARLAKSFERTARQLQEQINAPERGQEDRQRRLPR